MGFNSHCHIAVIHQQFAGSQTLRRHVEEPVKRVQLNKEHKLVLKCLVAEMRDALEEIGVVPYLVL